MLLCKIIIHSTKYKSLCTAAKQICL